ncbi:MAG: amidohydrolase family protein [Phycisphaerales bacterium]|nr:amidohydrolase family protein [Phycisphaerales bacterium]
MIVDCHTHIWESPEQLGKAKLELQSRIHRGMEASAREGAMPDASAEQHLRASEPVDKSFVLGFKSRYLSAEIPSDLVSSYVKQHPDKLIGVAGIDPTNLNEALEEMQRAYDEHGMRAITVSPAAQDFHPADSRAMQVFSEAARLKKPVFVHQGIHFSPASKMEFARPSLLDEVARELPQLKLVIAHLGYPWIDECIVLLGKHPNVFADISSLIHRPWQAYDALLAVYQYGVIDKLLFGSDFPYTAAAQAIESLYRINQLVTGTNLPTIPRQYLVSIVERDALGVLGIEAPTPPEEDASLLIDNEP